MASQNSIKAATVTADAVEKVESAVEQVAKAGSTLNRYFVIAAIAGVAVVGTSFYVARRFRKASKKIEADTAAVSE